MKQVIIFLSLLVAAFFLKADNPRKPFVILKINGKEYKSGDNINVRPGEKLTVEAILMGGRRDYCSNPQKYANVGQNTVITSKSEDGMSFYIGDGTFRGTWTLLSEKAVFSSGKDVKINKLNTNEKKQNQAVVEIPKSGYGQVFLTVDITTEWNYERHTQAGSSEEKETNTGKGTFYFKIETEEGVWYSSANLKAKGTENFSVRNSLDAVQRFYDEIYQQLQNKNFDNINMYVQNLKNGISSLKSTIDDEKSKDADYNCEITFIGLPSSQTMYHLKSFQTLSLKWKEQYLICEDNVSRITQMLLDIQNSFTLNILRSVFKNYINWGTSIPTGFPDFLTLYDPSSTLTVVSLPAKVMGWWQAANNDATILNNQVRTIQMLTDLQEFYIERMSKSVEERSKVQKNINELNPVKKIHSDFQNYFSTLTWANIEQ